MYYNFNDYEIKVFYDKEDNDYVAYLEEIPSLSSFGKTPQDALSSLEDIFNDYREIQKEDNELMPEPFNFRNYSGKLTVRLPKSLHKKLVERAAEESISLNQEILYLLSYGIDLKKRPA